MKRAILITIFLAIVLTILVYQKIEERRLIKWIGTYAIPITVTESDEDFNDLSSFRKILAGKKIVAMGEATHGTKEFFQMKSRVFKFLVKEMGFNVFALEASHSRCKYINEFVLTGKGNLDTAAVIQGFASWDTLEFREVIQWMRTYNATQPPNKIQFIGVDVQLNDVGAKNISRYIDRVSPPGKAKTDILLKKILKVERSSGIFSGDTSIRTLLRPIDSLLGDFNDKRSVYVEKTSIHEYQGIQDDIKTLRQYVIAFSYNPWDHSFVPWRNPVKETRDFFMAQNVLAWHSAHPSDKIFLWAHNGHVSKNYLDGESIPSMGSYIKEALMSEYYVVGFDFYRGKFRADDMDLKESPGWEEHEIKEAPKGSLGDCFDQAGKTNAFLDFTQTPKDKIIERCLLNRSMAMLSVGAQFSRNWTAQDYTSHVNIYRAFDAIIFIKESHPAVQLPVVKVERFTF